MKERVKRVFKASSPRRIVVVVLLAQLAGGCASSPYWRSRGYDAADVFTLTVGVGDGAKVRAGPLQAAAIRNSDLAGLRSGVWFADGNDLVDNEELYSPVPFWLLGRQRHRIRLSNLGRKPRVARYHAPPQLQLRPVDFIGDSWPTYAGYEHFSHGLQSVAAARGKDVVASSPFPLVAVSRSPAFYSQLEVEVGLLFSLRFGFNVLELLDFIIGWTGADLLHDDVDSVAR